MASLQSTSITGSLYNSGSVTIEGSGSTVFDVQGSQGQLFSITDNLSGSLFSVNDISGIPILEVFSDETVKLGTFGDEAIIVNGNTASITGSISGSVQGDGSGLTGITLDIVDSLISPSGTASLDLSNDTLAIIGGTLLDTTVGTKALTLNVDLSELSTSTSNGDGDYFVVVDTANAQKKLTKANIALSGFNNDSGWTSNTGTVTSVGGTGTVNGLTLTGTVTTTGNLTLGGTLSINNNDWSGADLSLANGGTGASLSDPGGDRILFWDDSAGTVTWLSAGTNITISGTTISATDTNTTYSAGTLLDLSGTTFNVDLSELTTSTADGDGDFFVVVDTANAQKKLTKANIALSGFNNDSGWTSNTGTVTSVGITAGTGLSGGGTVTTSGTISLAVDLSELTDMTATMVGTDEFIVLDASADRRKAANEIGLSIFNNDSGFTTNTGTVTSVGGTGTVNGLTLTGTVTSTGNLTLGGTLAINNSDWSGTDLSLANGGTGASLTDPNADRILFWDDSAGTVTWLSAGTNITISGTTISATDTNTTYSAGNGITLTGTTFSVAAGGGLTQDAGGLSHSDTSTLSGTYGSTSDGTKIDQITVDEYGHITAITTGSTGDILGVTAGTGLTGGGTSGTVTLNVVSANNGIVANADNIELATSSTTFTSGVKSKMDADGVISGSSQVDYNSIQNTPTIGNATITISAGTALTTGGDFTTNQTGNETITINHSPLFRSDSTDSQTLTFGGTFDAVSNVGTTTEGHVSGSTNKTFTLPILPSDNVTGTGTSGHVAYFTGTNAIGSESNLFWDATNNRLGIVDSTPSYTLDVNGDIRVTDDLFVNDFARIDALRVGTSNTDPGDKRLVVEGSAVFNEDGGNYDFRVESDTDVNMLFVDASSDRIGIGTSGPASRLSISGGYQTTLLSTNSFLNFGSGGSSPNRAQIWWGDSSGWKLHFGTKDGLDNFVERVTFVDTGEVGIGVTTADTRLHIKQSSTDAGGGIRLEDATSTNVWNISMDPSDDLTFYYNTSERGYLSNASNVSNIDFTGQHRSLVSETNDNIGETQISELLGLIVVSDGTYKNLSGTTEPQINESLPNIHLSDKEMDKRVFGVISDTEDINDKGRTYSMGNWVSVYPVDENEPQRLVINSLGEGGIWVCNYSGSFENGDYITTSPILGLGMKQNDDLLHNYTVAKITQDCNFDNSDDYVEIEFSGSSYRKQFVGCTYHCG